jgi:purine-binding chemotaxis protein CheW
MASDRHPDGGDVPGPAHTRESLLAFADSVLARQHEQPAQPALEILQFVTFFLRREEFGVPIMRTREIVRVGEITRIPEAPPHVRGVLNLRGRVLPIVDIRTRLGMEAAPVTPRSRVILVEAHGRSFGLLVDRISRIARIPAPTIKPPPPEALSGRADYVTGIAQVGEGLVILIDLDRALLLAPAEGEAPGSVDP